MIHIIKTHFGAVTPTFLNNSGCLNGNSIISLILRISFFNTPKSSYVILETETGVLSMRPSSKRVSPEIITGDEGQDRFN